MNITTIKGDLLDSNCIVLAHQVNCMGVMGSGVALAIKNKYPEVYLKYLNVLSDIPSQSAMGNCLIVPAEDNKYVANLFSQYTYNGYYKNIESYSKLDPYLQPAENFKRFTNYEALHRSLWSLKTEMTNNNIPSIAFPYKIGCDRGGGNWNIVSSMIESIFKDTNIYIEIREK